MKKNDTDVDASMRWFDKINDSCASLLRIAWAISEIGTAFDRTGNTAMATKLKAIAREVEAESDGITYLTNKKIGDDFKAQQQAFYNTMAAVIDASMDIDKGKEND